jgi:hypothetical protein
MSDTQQGPGWWQASDGKWYAPEQAPGATAPPAPAAPAVQDAKAEARAEKAYRKASRPWYKKKRWWFSIGFVVLIVIIIVAVSASVSNVAHKQHTVVYSVTGNGTLSSSTITYATVQEGNGQNGESQASDAALPWSKTITASGLFTDFTLSAQNGGSGSITCTITEDGKVINTNTATGQYAIATCDATGS